MPLAYDEARQAAVQYIGLSKNRSSGKVRARLAHLGTDRSTIDAVIAYLQEIDYLDDFRAARAILRKHVRARAKSRHMLRALLRAQGIPDDVASQSLQEGPDDEARALDLISSLYPEGDAESIIYKKLLSRGFHPDLSAALAARHNRHY